MTTPIYIYIYIYICVCVCVCVCVCELYQGNVQGLCVWNYSFIEFMGNCRELNRIARRMAIDI